MDKVRLVLKSCLDYLFVVLIAAILIGMLSFGFYDSSIVSWVGMIATSLIAIFLIWRLVNWQIKNSDKIKLNYLFIGLLIALILAQVIFIIIFEIVPSWDFGHVSRAAEMAVVPRGWQPLDLRWQEPYIQTYFLYYPHNYPLVIIYTVLYYLFGTSTYVLFGFGMVCIAITQFFIFLFLKNNFSKQTVIKLLMLMFTFYPYLSYCLIPYTDVVALPFFAMVLWLVIKDRKIRLSIPIVIALTVVMGVGSNIKILMLIPAIAYVIYWILHFQGFKTILAVVPLTGYILVHLWVASFWNQSTLLYSPYEHAGITPYYYMSLGLNLETMGQYSQNDYDESMNFADDLYNNDKEVIVEYYRDKVKERLSVGPQALTELYYNKIFYTFGIGDYGMSDYITRSPVKVDSQVRLFFTEGVGREMIFYYAEIMQFMFFIAMFYLGFAKRKNQSAEQMWLKTIFTGFFLYFMLFEAGSRYSLLMTPLFFYYLAACIEDAKVQQGNEE
ncbi:MAG: hypothetical protein ACK5LZ_05275 [Anaerorhabdus sp.]